MLDKMKLKVIILDLLVLLFLLMPCRGTQSYCSQFIYLESGKVYELNNKEYPYYYAKENHYMWQVSSLYTVRISCTLDMPTDYYSNYDKFSIQFSGGLAREYYGKVYFILEATNPIIRFDSTNDSAGGKFKCQIQALDLTDKSREDDCKCGWHNNNITRIVGGEETCVNEFPMMAGFFDIDLPELRIYCGATVISRRHVVTAAHCIQDRDINRLFVVVGEHNVETDNDTQATKVFRVKHCRIHPGFHCNRNLDDIAICETDKPIEFNTKVGPVCLPFQHRYDSFIGSFVTLLGWGLTETGANKAVALQKVEVSVISTTECGRLYPAKEQITQSHICTFTKEKDACQMDSGGPVLWKNPTSGRFTLVGITTRGSSCGGDLPGIATHVADYLDWIKYVTPDIEYCQKE